MVGLGGRRPVADETQLARPADEAGLCPLVGGPVTATSTRHDPSFIPPDCDRFRRMRQVLRSFSATRREISGARSQPLPARSGFIIRLCWDSGRREPRLRQLDGHVRDLRDAHALDPSRTITHTFGPALKPMMTSCREIHMRPFDDTVYRHGWFDNHHAGGPEVWRQNLLWRRTNITTVRRTAKSCTGARKARSRLRLDLRNDQGRVESPAASRMGWRGFSSIGIRGSSRFSHAGKSTRRVSHCGRVDHRHGRRSRCIIRAEKLS